MVCAPASAHNILCLMCKNSFKAPHRLRLDASLHEKNGMIKCALYTGFLCVDDAVVVWFRDEWAFKTGHLTKWNQANDVRKLIVRKDITSKSFSYRKMRKYTNCIVDDWTDERAFASFTFHSFALSLSLPLHFIWRIDNLRCNVNYVLVRLERFVHNSFDRSNGFCVLV